MDKYEVKRFNRLGVSIGICKIDSLIPHEMIVNELLDELTRDMRETGVIRNLPVVDANTGLIIDGTHRIAALKKLGCLYAPVCLIDYTGDNRVKIFSWFRLVGDFSSIDEIKSVLRSESISIERYFSRETLRAPSIVYGEKVIKFKAREKLDAYGSFKKVNEIEIKFRRSGYHVEYVSEHEGFKRLKTDRHKCLLVTPRLTKDDVLSVISRGKVFAPKSTRHIVPVRFHEISVPIDLLKSLDLERIAKALYEKIKLSSLTCEDLKEVGGDGQIYNVRIYLRRKE